MLTLYNSSTCYLEVRTDAGDNNSGIIFSKGSAQDSDSYRGYIAYNHSTDYMTFHTGGGTRRGMFDANGLHFDTNNNSAATGLDDYEEGTWTPTITFGGGSTGMNLSASSGYYVKIGRLVNIGGTIIFTDKGSSTGAAELKSLPFTVGDNDGATSAEGGGVFTYFANMAVDKTAWYLRGSNNSTAADIAYIRSGGHTAMEGATNTDFTATTTIRFVMTYQT